jgi:hypothetical protein
MINGQILTRSTKTADRKLAEQIAAKWEAEAVKEIFVDGRKTVLIHNAIDAFLRAKKGTGGYSNARVHMAWWRKLANKPLKNAELHEVQAIVAERWEAGAAQNTVAVTVGYWDALINFCLSQGWTSGVKLHSGTTCRHCGR